MRKSQADEELRSRVWWCCYILDKVLAEETGRPVLLHARRSTTPLPASAEADEYELWPPPSRNRERYEDGSRSDRYGSATVFEPAQGRLLSAFQTTCKLGVIVEEILDLDEEGPRYERSTGTGKDEEEEFQKKSMESALRKKDALAKALEDWYADLPDQLNVDVTIPRPAPTHLIVNLAVSPDHPLAFLSTGDQVLTRRIHSGTTLPSSCCTHASSHLNRTLTRQLAQVRRGFTESAI